MNLENDMIGKYVEKLMNLGHDEKTSAITEEMLMKAGF